MEIVDRRGSPDLATVYVARLDDGELIEFVQSVQPPVPPGEKLVFIVSTLRGCPVDCPICDAGGRFGGRLTREEILGQIDFLTGENFPDGRILVPKLKIQFARMGDPAFNDSVIDVLDEIPSRYGAPGIMPCISTIAPAGRDRFFDELTGVKRKHYGDGMFQMQFSLHTSCEEAKRELVPVETWSFRQMADWGRDFHSPGDRRIALNFAPVHGFPLDPEAIRRAFSPEIFMIKLTPVNPTRSATGSGMRGTVDPLSPESGRELVDDFRRQGFQTILSIGELRENQIGSNCGMFVSSLAEVAGGTAGTPV